MIIIGIDPGTRVLGYGVIEVQDSQGKLLDYGILKVKTGQPFSLRLLQIDETIHALIAKHHPDVMAVEEAFVYKNARTALALGHARGVVLVSAARNGISVAEYAPRDIKKAVTGNGAASKQQVQWMVSQMLHLKGAIEEDAADGLAAALCHAMRSTQKMDES